MKIVKKAVWFSVALLGAFSLAVVVGIVNSAKKVNSIWLVVLLEWAWAYFTFLRGTRLITLDNPYEGGKRERNGR